MERGELTRLTGTGTGNPDDPPCGGDDCPNVYRHDERGSIIVQGNRFEGFPVSDGEALVEIPDHVLREAFRALGW
ncbi:hypothetical protein [Streptomyces sp. H27-D2]|uniref:hypothetical protein n=1 Tax=Streptomyces sp. H27-D2 TaxID=3046304 RepID=UPI002DBFAB67|nr:hypothetical protein [Streptomyces sp. H27-D2]MEC4018376.1 hypothetical protein [Streptomyces sp. H27-D2]